MKRLKKVLMSISPVLVFVLIFAIIEAAVNIFQVPKFVMATPSSSFRYLFTHFGTMRVHLWKSLWQFLLGYPIGALIGVTFALIFSSSKVLSKAISPYLTIIICTPQLIMVPLLKMWLGFGAVVCVIASALSCFAVIMTNTMTGVSMVPYERIELMQTCKGNKWQLFWMVIFPSSLPSVFTGLKLGCIFALSGIIGAEITGDTKGLGAMILTSAELVKLPQLFAYIYLLMILGYIVYSIICFAESKLVRENA